jgi:hypothetical protein
MRQRRSAVEVEQLLQDYRARGEVTGRAFAEARGLSLAALNYYLRRYSQEPPTRLARIHLNDRPETSGRFALVLGNGRRIECAEAELPALIRTAEAC